jgi:carbon monoxide dehydrogenase subunit G
MRIDQEFTVARPLTQVWDFFQDVPEVAKCLPGAELTEALGGGEYKGKLDAKMGPMSISFEGKAKVTTDVDSKTGVIEGSGADRRGGSRGKVKVDYVLVAVGNGTQVTMEADVTLSGPAAQFGRVGLIKEMSARLIMDFTACLEGKLAAETVEEAEAITASELSGIRLFFASLGSIFANFLRKLFGREN